MPESRLSSRIRFPTPGWRAFGHSFGGHRCVASSDTLRRYDWPSSVKRLFGWRASVGSDPSRGRRPSRIAGTACVVESNTVVACEYHVERPASVAKFG